MDLLFFTASAPKVLVSFGTEIGPLNAAIALVS
jgi:hypothetical protein